MSYPDTANLGDARDNGGQATAGALELLPAAASDRVKSRPFILHVEEDTTVLSGKRRAVWRPISKADCQHMSQCATLVVHQKTDVFVPASSDVSSDVSSLSSVTFEDDPAGSDVEEITFVGGCPFAGAASDVSSLSSPPLQVGNDLGHSLPRAVWGPTSDAPGPFVLAGSDCSSLTSRSPHNPQPPLTKLLLDSAYRIDAWWNNMHELVCILVPLLYYMISIAMAACWRPNLEGSRLYESIDLTAEFRGFPLSGWVLMLCSVNISSGASQLFTTAREVMRSGSWPLVERRLELLSRFYTVAPMLAYSIVLLLASVDPDEHRRRTRIAALVTWLVWALVFTVRCPALIIFVHPNEAFLRPALLDPSMIVSAVFILLGQAEACGFIGAGETFLSSAVLLAALLFYLACFLCFLNTLHRLWRLWRHGEPLPGRFYDVLAIASFLLVSLNLYSFVGLESGSRLVVSGTNIDFSTWLMLRMAPGSVFLTVWAVRCSEILLQRAEQEAMLREAALLELEKQRGLISDQFLETQNRI